MTFNDFWTSWPDKRGKFAAEKAFNKLSAADKDSAATRSAEWAAQWRKDYPLPCAHIHAATYLNQRRFYDLDEVKAATSENSHAVLVMYADAIKSQKRFMLTHIKPEMVAAILANGLATESECRMAGVA